MVILFIFVNELPKRYEKQSIPNVTKNSQLRVLKLHEKNIAKDLLPYYLEWLIMYGSLERGW